MNSLFSKLYKHRYRIIFCHMFSLAKYKTVFIGLVLFCLCFPVCSLWLGKETFWYWIMFEFSVTKRDLGVTLLLTPTEWKWIPCSPCKIFLKYLSCSAVPLPAQITCNSVNFFFSPDSTRDVGVVFYPFEAAMDSCHSSTCFLPIF